MTVFALLAIVAVCGSAVTAQSPEERAAARALMARRGDAIVTLLGTMKTRMAMNGREMSVNEARLQTNATILDPGGLGVVSLTAIEPDNLFGGFFAQEAETAGVPPMKMETKSETTDLRLRFADGKEVPVKVVRKGEEKTITVKLGKLEDEAKTASADAPDGVPAEPPAKAIAGPLGLTLSDLSPDARKKFGIKESVVGVVVTEIEPGSAAAEKRRALAVAQEQEMRARVEENRAQVVLSEAEVPRAIAQAFREGHLGVMEYYQLRNLQSDTQMRNSIANVGNSGAGERSESR